MRIPLAIALCTWSVAATAQPHLLYRVSSGGAVVGKAYFKHLPEPDGGRRLIWTLFLKSGGLDIRVRNEAVYSSEGLPTYKLLETEYPAMKRTDRAEVTLTKGLATGTITTDRKVRKVNEQLDPSLPVADPSIFWFRTVRPEVGDRVTFYHFDLDALRWSLVETSYVGPRTLTIDGREVEGHMTITTRAGEDGEVFMGGDGNVLRMRSGPFVIERQWDDPAPKPKEKPATP